MNPIKILKLATLFAQAANSDQTEFIDLMNINGVRYVVIGGAALEGHGLREPAKSNDLDVVVDENPDNLRKLYKVVNEFMPIRVSEEQFLSMEKLPPLGIGTGGIELIKNNEHLPPFGELFASSEMKNVSGVEARVLSLEMILRLKQEANRGKDQEDIKKLLDILGPERKVAAASDEDDAKWEPHKSMRESETYKKVKGKNKDKDLRDLLKSLKEAIK